jgi:hypothetical protein
MEINSNVTDEPSLLIHHFILFAKGPNQIEKMLRDAEKQVDDKALIGVGLMFEGKAEKDADLLQNVVKMKPRNLWLADLKNNFHELSPFVRLALQLDPTMKIFAQACICKTMTASIRTDEALHLVFLQNILY